MNLNRFHGNSQRAISLPPNNITKNQSSFNKINHENVNNYEKFHITTTNTTNNDSFIDWNHKQDPTDSELMLQETFNNFDIITRQFMGISSSSLNSLNTDDDSGYIHTTSYGGHYNITDSSSSIYNSNNHTSSEEFNGSSSNTTKDELLLVMIEDLVDWFKKMYPTMIVDLNSDNFFDRLSDGVLLCYHATQLHNRLITETKDKKSIQLDQLRISGLQVTIPNNSPNYQLRGLHSSNATISFISRDNVSNFIQWCRQLGMHDSTLFESEDLVCKKNPRHVIICLLELARLGGLIGMCIPEIVQLEVRELLSQCTCKQTFPMVRIGEGRYLFGDKSTQIFVRILRNHVMVRVGGGWDTLSHFLSKYDECRKVNPLGSCKLSSSYQNDNSNLIDSSIKSSQLNQTSLNENEPQKFTECKLNVIRKRLSSVTKGEQLQKDNESPNGKVETNPTISQFIERKKIFNKNQIHSKKSIQDPSLSFNENEYLTKSQFFSELNLTSLNDEKLNGLTHFQRFNETDISTDGEDNNFNENLIKDELKKTVDNIQSVHNHKDIDDNIRSSNTTDKLLKPKSTITIIRSELEKSNNTPYIIDRPYYLPQTTYYLNSRHNHNLSKSLNSLNLNCKQLINRKNLRPVEMISVLPTMNARNKPVEIVYISDNNKPSNNDYIIEDRIHPNQSHNESNHQLYSMNTKSRNGSLIPISTRSYSSSRIPLKQY
ncbi:growth arrest-specific 2-related [Schistosoma mansoni]|uniref:growth arrest-specific 2-related n=1 Tax=Schistosoma mansoni TaxID=6183 RepID=UPI00022C81D6|nr:growth arrest-specific 2-related [Schistosoma mansoni]|eukprot:XP_018647390.1 growth arrest-specific 2-related [Schistosoma mansoni]